MKKRIVYIALIALFTTVFTSCSKGDDKVEKIDDKYRTYYEVFLYSYYDSDGDGIGDIKGLTSKLDYIEELGFNGIWLMPIMPSPTYHKYDTTDYYTIDPEYGTLDAFEELIKECEKREIRVIIDLVLNHTSNEHPWFESAVRSVSIEPCGQDICIYEELCRQHNVYCEYYNFAEKDSGSSYTKLSNGWYYESVFWSGMPDLNLDSQLVREEFEDIMNFWLDFGVAGFRLDAAKEFHTGNREKNIEVLAWVSDYVKGLSEDYYLVAEVWETFLNYTPYYESGIDSVFNFAFSEHNGKIAKTLNLKGAPNGGKSFADAMVLVQDTLLSYHKDAIDAPFFSNHDVGRIAGFLRQDERKIKIGAAMNLFMSGTVFVYYGEEIGMSGSGRDENIRAPMIWSETNLSGMTDGPREMEEVISGFPSVEEQIQDDFSIYTYYKNAIRLRNTYKAIARGAVAVDENLSDDDICAITKIYDDEQLLLIYNVSEEDRELVIDQDRYADAKLGGILTVDENKIEFKNTILTIPAYGVAIIKY